MDKKAALREIIAVQKEILSIVKKMPKLTMSATNAQILKAKNWGYYNTDDLQKWAKVYSTNINTYSRYFPIVGTTQRLAEKTKRPTLSATSKRSLPSALKKKAVNKLPLALQRKIDEINKMLPELETADEMPGGYFGSTHYSYVELEKPIEVKGNFVYIYGKPGRYNVSFEKRYNINKKDAGDWGGLEMLKHDLNIINKAFKQALK
jgi:hypothetical protein